MYCRKLYRSIKYIYIYWFVRFSSAGAKRELNNNQRFKKKTIYNYFFNDLWILLLFCENLLSSKTAKITLSDWNCWYTRLCPIPTADSPVRYLPVGAGSAEDFHFGWRTVGWRRWLVRKGFTIDKNALSQNFAIMSDCSKRWESWRRFGPFDFVLLARLLLRLCCKESATWERK